MTYVFLTISMTHILNMWYLYYTSYIYIYSYILHMYNYIFYINIFAIINWQVSVPGMTSAASSDFDMDPFVS